MSFIRPQARAALWRWREVIAGAGLLTVALWWLLRSGGILAVLAVPALLAAGALAWVGIQRARFRGPGGGPGTVEVDEGQITYFGPLTGGTAALAEMTELALIRRGTTPHWRLGGVSGPLHIPVDAEGADALFDAFATLPGLKTSRLVAALEADDDADSVIWHRPTVRPPTVRLH